MTRMLTRFKKAVVAAAVGLMVGSATNATASMSGMSGMGGMGGGGTKQVGLFRDV